MKYLLFLILPLLISVSSAAIMPDVHLLTTENDQISFSDYRGQVFLFLAMTTDCSSCEMENSYLLDIYDTTSNFTILSIAIDPQVDSLDTLTMYKNNHEIPWVVALDSDAKLQQIYQIKSYPQLFLVNQTGDVVKRWIGITSSDTIQQSLAQYVTMQPLVSHNPLLEALLSNPLIIIFSAVFSTGVLVYLIRKLIRIRWTFPR